MKILILDIELAPMVIYQWSLDNRGWTSPNNIVEDSYVLTWAAGWHNQKKVYSDSIHKSGKKGCIQSIHKLLDAADCVVGYNSIQFDMKILESKFLEYGLPRVEYNNIDLMRVCKRHFRFSSFSMNYVAKKLKIGQEKLETGGFDLWKGCMAGKASSFKKMLKYNIQDIHVTRALYYKLRPYMKEHPNYGLFREERVCPTCGSDKINKKGLRYNKTSVYQRWYCTNCSSHSQSRQAEKLIFKDLLKQ